jgi:hypothetical protein
MNGWRKFGFLKIGLHAVIRRQYLCCRLYMYGLMDESFYSHTKFNFGLRTIFQALDAYGLSSEGTSRNLITEGSQVLAPQSVGSLCLQTASVVTSNALFAFCASGGRFAVVGRPACGSPRNVSLC